jgi:hypothetical protein
MFVFVPSSLFSTSLEALRCQELTLINALTLLSLDCDYRNVVDLPHHRILLAVAQLYSPIIIVYEGAEE